MRMLMMLALLPAMATAADAPAADRTVWALCLSGEGCQTCQTTLTHAQADRSLGALGLVSGNPGHTVVTMRKSDGEWSWYYDTRRTPADLDRYFGGAGRGVLATCPTLPGAIQPRDGHWRIQHEPAQPRDCPRGVDAGVAAIQMQRSGDVVFRKPFRAADALPDAAVAWLQVGPDSHVGSFQPAGAAGMQARYTLDVVSPERMRGTLVVHVPIPGQRTCRITVPFRYERTGPSAAAG